MNYLQQQLRRLRYEVRNIIADYPPVYLPLARLKSNSDAAQIVDNDTQLLIEGWPRSGNTFAEQAFRMSQPFPVRFAHHFHAPAQVIAAVGRSLPILLLVREPTDAVCSFVIRETALSLNQALRSWIRFYESVFDYRDGYVVATFDQVTTDFGRVMARVNSRYRTDFGIFRHTDENVKHCFRLIEANNRQRFGKGSIVETGIARPSDARAVQKRELLHELSSASLAPLVRQARELYGFYRMWASNG